MVIVISEESKFMPSITTTINNDKITVEENGVTKVLKYQKEQIQQIIEFLLNLFKDWKDKDCTGILQQSDHTFDRERR